MTMWRMSSLAFILISLLLSVVTVPVPVTVRSQTTSTPPLQVTVFTPKPGDVMGINGLGWVVDLAIDATSVQFNSLLSPAAGYKPAFLNPLNSTQFHVGNSSAVPGLVCLFNSTGGTNFAGVFEINGVALTNNGTTAEVWSTWYIPIANLSGQTINMTVYVVNGTAPSTLPTGTTILPNIISNVANVLFSVSA